MASRQPARSARPPGENWQDSYFTLDERYRQLQQRFNAQERELKMLKVDRRKAEAPPRGPSLSSVPSARRPSLRPAAHADNAPNLNSLPYYQQHARGEPAYPSVVPHGAGAAGVKAPPRHLSQSPPASSAPPPLHSAFDRYAASELSSTATHNQENTHDGSQRTPMLASYVAPLPSALEPSARTQEYVAVPSAALPQAARAAAAAEALGDAASLPDPSMVWGTDGQSSMQNYVVASALYHANEELRRKLNESSVTLQTLQQELANTRAQHAAAQSRLEGVAQQMHQLVRERDLAAQKYTNAAHTITDLERTLRDRVAEEEKIRFSMESQITELRSRLVVGADSNELLQKDVRSLLTETRDRTGEVMQLRSKLALAESALSSQRNVNENMLVELKSLNAQLVEERRRLITVTREAQVASLSGTRIADLQGQLRRAQEERGTLEREHVGLMAEFVRVTEDALRHAREEVRTDVADWKAAAEHWERVSQLLYKDIAERTQQHLQCRDECEAAKEQRDTAGQQLRTLKEDVALLTAKLHVAWPSHLEDAKGLSAADILNAFGSGEGQGIFLFDSRRRRAVAAAAATAQRRRKQHDGTTSGATAAAAAVGETAAAVEGEAGTVDSDHSSVYESDAALRGMEWAVGGMDDFPADTTTAVTQLQELHEVNAALVAEVHQLRLTNEMLQDRLGQVTGRQKSEQARVAAAEASLQKRERAGHQLLERQLDRVAFLEAQVKSLRGYHIPSNVPVDQIGDRENIFELFLGQLVAASVPEGVEVPDLFSQIFCSVDFLLHETITTPTVRGLNGFFDVTASFCVSMDALLFYYLHTRRLLVQLHRVRTTGEAAAAAAAAVTAAQKEKTDSAVEEGEAGASPTPHAPADDAVHRQHGGRGSSSSGGSSHGSGASTASHPSLRLAENMFETIAEGQVSLVEIIQSDECLQAARPTMRGHVRLVTPDQRHIASLEFRLTARRPYSPEFLQVLQEAAAKQRQDEAETAGDGSGVDAGATAAAAVAPPLLEWMQATANASADADLRPLSEPRVFAGDRAPSTLARGARREAQAGSSRGHRASPSRRPPSHMQLIPVSEGDDGTSSSSSFIVQHRSRVAETPGALVAHLPAPSPPPSATQQQLRSSSYLFDSVEGGTGRARGLRGDTAESGLAGRDASASSLRPATPPSAFVHVDRSLLMQTAPAQPQHHRSSNSSGGGFVGSITCLWVDVERLELPADLPVPIPRLSCYFCVPALRSETWLAAPPTARYTWPYAAEHRSGASEIAVGTPLPISSVTQLAAVVREPLVLFFLDADAMATAPSPPPAHARSGQAVAEGSAGGSAVWAMAVCEWTQVAQQPNSPHHFSLPLLRRDQSLVSGAVVRLTLTATTAAGQPLSLLQVPPPLQHPQPNTAFTAATAVRGASGVGGGGVDFPPSSSPAGHCFSPPAGAPPPGAAEPPASMEEELLRLEYDQRLARSGL